MNKEQKLSVPELANEWVNYKEEQWLSHWETRLLQSRTPKQQLALNELLDVEYARRDPRLHEEDFTEDQTDYSRPRE